MLNLGDAVEVMMGFYDPDSGQDIHIGEAGVIIETVQHPNSVTGDKIFTILMKDGTLVVKLYWGEEFTNRFFRRIA